MHALLLEGSHEWALTMLPVEYRTEGADTVHLHGGRMGIDEVRALIHEAHLTPLVQNERVFIISYNDITPEAQNALLKILEEPPQTSRFYVVISQSVKLLPTLRSRLMLLGEEHGGESGKEFEAFLQESIGDRLKKIGERMTKKDDAWAVTIMRGIETYAGEKKKPELLKALTQLRPYFERSGASKKMILEHLALLLSSA
jgi:hypothetical protein